MSNEICEACHCEIQCKLEGYEYKDGKCVKILKPIDTKDLYVANYVPKQS